MAPYRRAGPRELFPKYLDIYFCTFLLSRSQQYQWEALAQNMREFLSRYLADVRGAFGPYLGVFLVTQQHWNQTAVGLIATVGGLGGLAVHAP